MVCKLDHHDFKESGRWISCADEESGRRFGFTVRKLRVGFFCELRRIYNQPIVIFVWTVFVALEMISTRSAKSLPARILRRVITIPLLFESVILQFRVQIYHRCSWDESEEQMNVILRASGPIPRGQGPEARSPARFLEIMVVKFANWKTLWRYKTRSMKSIDNSAVCWRILEWITGSSSGEFSLHASIQIIARRSKLTNPCQWLQLTQWDESLLSDFHLTE